MVAVSGDPPKSLEGRYVVSTKGGWGQGNLYWQSTQEHKLHTKQHSSFE